MPGKTCFEKLLSPFQLKEIKLRNRIVKAPQATGLCIKGTGIENQGGVDDRIVAHYESLAKGGVGLIIVEAAVVDFPLGLIDVPNITIYDDKFIPGLRELTERVHRHGAAIFVELIHGGPVHPKRLLGQPIAASSLPPDEMPIRDFDKAREATLPEIKDIQLAFAKAAERAVKAGFDGVEVHGSQRYLINTFLSRAWNKRQDAYGCQDLESRARFGVEVMQAVRERVGQHFIVGIRLNGGEWGLEKGITAEESQAFGQMFEAAGADFLDISGYGYGSFLWAYFAEQLRFLPGPEVKPWLKTIDKPGLIITRAEQIKKRVSIPVISGGRIEPHIAEWDLQKGKIDLVFMGRRLLADPQLPNKLVSGRPEDIAPCTACCECMEALLTDGQVRCRVNAALGKEREYEFKSAKKKKKVIVVGGGPAGMEAARVAAMRGHEVILFDKEKKLGGKLSLAAVIKGDEIEDLMALVNYFGTQMTKLGVTLRLGEEVTLPLIEELLPDAVIIAAGGLPVVPQIPGIHNSKKVITAAHLYRMTKPALRFLGPKILEWATRLWMPLGMKIAVMGGNIQGCQLAEFLVKRGREVTIVEASNELGTEIVGVMKQRLLSWLDKKGVAMWTGVKYEEITDKGLVILNGEGKRQTIEADQILLALPLSPNHDLWGTLEGRVPELHMIGDCGEPHRIVHAIADGSRIGHAI